MQKTFTEPSTGALLSIIDREPGFARNFFEHRTEALLTIAWNRGPAQRMVVDGEEMVFPENHVVALVVNQSFQFEHPKHLTAWQFNREFYCIVDHDAEVSCAGLLFYGTKSLFFARLDTQEVRRFELLYQVFVDELAEADSLQAEMLRMLLKRLIVKLTRLYKLQHLTDHFSGADLDTVRRFNLLVEHHYQTRHQVQDYADLLHKSPKTLSNLFSRYSEQTPLQVIHQRILLEARRLLIYTDLSSKEIAHRLGFKETSHFSRFFQKMTGQRPSVFRHHYQKPRLGKN